MTGAALLNGEELARRLRAGLAGRAADLRSRGVVPRLATLLVGEDGPSAAYISRKHADCAEVGIASLDLRLPATTSVEELRSRVDALNADPAMHGFLVQLPLPARVDAAEFLARIDPRKDIDGLHPENLGRLAQGTPGIMPCTPLGILKLLRHHEVPLSGREVAIVGRGALVGRPLAMLLTLKGIDATVTLTHSRGAALGRILRRSDVVVSAAGVQGLIRAAMVKPGAAVVGVGISFDATGRMVSDIADDVAGVAGWVTPPHGSVGALTRTMLMSNLLDLAQDGAQAGCRAS